MKTSSLLPYSLKIKNMHLMCPPSSTVILVIKYKIQVLWSWMDGVEVICVRSASDVSWKSVILWKNRHCLFWNKVLMGKKGQSLTYRFQDSHSYTMYVTVREWGRAGMKPVVTPFLSVIHQCFFIAEQTDCKGLTSTDGPTDTWSESKSANSKTCVVQS